MSSLLGLEAEELVDGVVVLWLGGELDVPVTPTLVRVTAELVHGDRHGELRRAVHVDVVVGQDQVDHGAGREARVDGELPGDSGHELLVGDRVAQALRLDRCRQDAQELVVPADPRNVALRLLGPVGGVVRGHPGALVLDMACPHDLERLGPVQLDAAGRLDVQARVGVVDRLGEVHLDTPQGLDHVDEAVEVQLDEMLDRDPEVLFDRGDQLIRSLVQRGVDLVGAVGTGVRDEEVARDGEDRYRMVGRVQVEDHHHVAVHAVDALGAQAVGGVLHREGAPIRRTDHQDVLGAGVVALHGSGGQVLQVDAVDLMVEVPAVSGGGPGDQHEDQCQRPPHPGRGALPGARFGAAWAGPCRASSSAAVLALRRPRPPVRVASSIWRPSSWRPFSTGSSAGFSAASAGRCAAPPSIC